MTPLGAANLVLYLDDPYRDLYDVQADPGEVNNLWHVEALGSLCEELSTACLCWLARGALTANRRASRAPQQAMRI